MIRKHSANTTPAVRIIIQARTDSSRLPGKALLPVAGMPSAILAARRAANRGREVLLATSDRPIDDQLASIAEAAGITVFRGSSDDVRSRFLSASSDLTDQDIVIRLTADNTFPDGELIEEFLEIFGRTEANYLNLDMVWQAPPYGLALEIIRLGALRSIAYAVNDPDNLEHVTPALRSKHTCKQVPQSFFKARESKLRCTVDTLDDYHQVTRVFEGIESPAQVSWRELIRRLAELPDAPPVFASGPGLILGTAQLGAPYGSIQQVTPPHSSQAIEMVRRAIKAGVTAIDTAHAYVGSENVVGRALQGGWDSRVHVITKLSPLTELSRATLPAYAAAAAETSVLRSLHALGPQTRPSLMLHRAYHLNAWQGAIWSKLIELREEGLISNLGVSVQTADEARAAIACPDVRIIQMPLNILDRRWNDAGIPALLAERPDLEVHVRSVFLQGILLRSSQAWPRINGIDPSSVLNRLDNLCKTYERQSIADLCVAWVRAQPWVTGVVLGMESLDQLEENLSLFSLPPLSLDDAQEIQASLPEIPGVLLNPALWKMHFKN